MFTTLTPQQTSQHQERSTATTALQDHPSAASRKSLLSQALEKASANELQHPLTQDQWQPIGATGIETRKANDLSEASPKLKRDLGILRLSFIRGKTLELIKENPDTPFESLAQVTLGGISEEGLSHLSHRHLARKALDSHKPKGKSASQRLTDWSKRPKTVSPSRFQQEFLQQQQKEQAQTEAMDSLINAFKGLTLNKDSSKINQKD